MNRPRWRESGWILRWRGGRTIRYVKAIGEKTFLAVELTPKGWVGNVMVWTGFEWTRRGRTVACVKDVTAKRYAETLDRKGFSYTISYPSGI